MTHRSSGQDCRHLPELSHSTMSASCLQPVAILWDIENCAIPSDVNVEDVAVHIRLALKVQLAMEGPIIVFSAYGDYSHLPRHTRQGCHKTGVNLIDIPHGKKDVVDKAILVDMFQFALDNPPPCTVVLISGNVDFSPALHKLGRRGYCMVLAIPLSPKLSPALCNACQYLWSWPDVARGKVLNLVKSPSICVTNESKPLEVAMQNDKLPKMGAPNAKIDCLDLAKGKEHAKAEGVEGNNLEAGPSGNQNGNENSRKMPVGLFEECVKLPFYFAKKSTEIPFVTSNIMTGYDNVNPLMSQNLNGGVASCKFAPLSDQYVCDRFAVPYPENAHMLGEEGIDHSWKKHVHPTKADFEHHIGCMHADAGTANVGPLFNMGHKLARDVRGWENHSPGSIRRSQNAQKVSANSEHVTPAQKQAAHVKSQGSPSQLKVKKKKMKKTKEDCVIAAAPGSTQKEKKMKPIKEHCVIGEAPDSTQEKKKMKQIKEHRVIGAAPVASPKLSKKQRKAARLAALQQEGFDHRA